MIPPTAFLYVCCEKCYIIIVVLRGGLLPLPDEMQQPAQEERQHVAECGDDSHGNGVEHNGVGVQKCATCEHHDCFADTDAARSTGGNEADDPREQVSPQKQPHLCPRNVEHQECRHGIHGGGEQVLQHVEQENANDPQQNFPVQQFAVLFEIPPQRLPKLPAEQEKRQHQYGNTDAQHQQEILLIGADQSHHVFSHEQQDPHQRSHQRTQNFQNGGTGNVHVADVQVCGKLVSSHVLEHIPRHVFHQIALGVYRQSVFHGDFLAGQDSHKLHPRGGHEENNGSLYQHTAGNDAQRFAGSEHRPVHVHSHDLLDDKDECHHGDQRTDQLIIFFQEFHKTTLSAWSVPKGTTASIVSCFAEIVKPEQAKNVEMKAQAD